MNDTLEELADSKGRSPKRSSGLMALTGNSASQSFHLNCVGAEIVERSKTKQGKLVRLEVKTFSKIALRFTGKEMCRCFVLEPASQSSRYEHGPFFIEGFFKITEKVNGSTKASEFFREFQAS